MTMNKVSLLSADWTSQQQMRFLMLLSPDHRRPARPRATGFSGACPAGSAPPGTVTGISGTAATAVVTVTGTGNQPALLTAVTPPSGPFGLRYQVPAGLQLNPGDDLRIPVRFRPRSAAPSPASSG